MIAYSFIALIIISHILFLDIYTIIFVAHLGLISTLYNVPNREESRSIIPFRSIPFLKVFLISYVWASISSILPAIDTREFSQEYVWIFTSHFLFILAITLPFDIRDLKTDLKNNIITVPNVIGITGTKIFALSTLFLSNLIIIYQKQGLALLAVFIIAGFLIIKSSPKRKDHYYTIFIDGTIILYFVIVKFLVS